ncbi:MAG TPA: GlcNAc-PI de-N-acetylase [Ruminococcaceae bacterium]|nr:GlcNAc-PI de-N-acetylase [Oscillospiraceae bacterium]
MQGSEIFSRKRLSRSRKLQLPYHKPTTFSVRTQRQSQYKNNPKLLQIIEKKKAETEKAAEILNIKTVNYGGLPDMMLDCTPHTEVNSVIERTIEKYKPDTIFTHFWGDVNKDHRCVYESVAVAARPMPGQMIKEIYCFRVPSSTEWMPYQTSTMFMPNVFFNISKYADKKSKAMAAYETEIRDYPHPRSLLYLKKIDEATGLQVGSEAVEPFVLLRKIT